uniref:Solute carrier family 46 member 3 n=1 Tax=Heterorhabditis bacteriophora TaxID=37862 RepID=A0A1I7XHG1_HETBA
MNSRRFEILCVTLLGFGQMCMMTGYDAQHFLSVQSVVVESVMHSVNEREPWRIDAYAESVMCSFIDEKFLLLTPLFIHTGFYVAFLLSVFPTSLHFTSALVDCTYLPALYTFTVGVGEILMCIFISFMSKRFKNFGLMPTMVVGYVHTTVIFTSLLAAFEMGLSDACINNVRTVICAIAMPNRRSQAFSNSKFYQALGGATLMYFTPYLSIYNYTGVLFITLTLSTILFYVVAEKIKIMERKVIEEK